VSDRRKTKYKRDVSIDRNTGTLNTKACGIA
jgi:hypothetical protein